MYLEIFTITQELLGTSPLNRNYLYYNGVSGFYTALTISDQNRRQEFLDNALYSLRKIISESSGGIESQVHYILGKIYFHKGTYFFDLAEKYLNLAKQAVFPASDINEYLSAIYLDTDRNDEGIELLRNLIEKNPRDILYFALASAYEDQNDYTNALKYYQITFDTSNNNLLKQEILIGKGRVLFALNNLEDAEVALENAISLNSQAAEAYFYLGEIYALKDDSVRARANWREAYNQDRTFLRALERLNS